jgi:hypothetical protein
VQGYCRAGAGLVKSFTRLGQGWYWLVHGLFMLVLLVQTGAGEQHYKTRAGLVHAGARLVQTGAGPITAGAGLL